MSDNDDDNSHPKLRKAKDVLDRLRWDTSGPFTADTTLVGYDDRIRGPMEQPTADFATIHGGGDIPEHRVTYVRRFTDNAPCAHDIVWDRLGRVDRLFGSGEGAHAAIHPETLRNAQQAWHTMQELEEERRAHQDVEVHNRQARHTRRELAAQAMAGYQEEDRHQQEQEIHRQTSEVRRQLEDQSIEDNDNPQSTNSNNNDTNTTHMEVENAQPALPSRKRPLEEILQATKADNHNNDTQLPLNNVNRIRLEAIFHPKFENESERDHHIRSTMKEHVAKGEGYLEVSLKHSGSLLLWSGGQRYYSKNSTDNKFTHVGEILLRQHFVRAYWTDDHAPDTEAGDSVALTEARYQACSQHVEAERLTLAFEAVTAVLGDHGDRPKRDFLILTAVADRSQERFYSTAEVVDLAQRFRLPHNDVWQFSSETSCDALFDFYDTCRETSLATFVQDTLTQAAEIYIPSVYPHVAFQGDILEGIVIRYVSNPSSGGNSLKRMGELAKVAKDLCETKVPPSLPDCSALVQNVPSCPVWLSCDLRKMFQAARSSAKKEGPGSFAHSVESVLSQCPDRRTGQRLPKQEAAHVPSLLRKLAESSDDEETRRIARVVQSLHTLNIRVDYSVFQEDISGFGFSRWLCVIHVLLDHAHQKYRKNMVPGDMALFRGFALELSSDHHGHSANKKAHSRNWNPTDSGSDNETGLMLKMKFLPYMVRTFGCRNGLKSLSQGGPEAFVRYTSGLLTKWKMSPAARKTWMPFFRAWADYAAPRLGKQPLPEDGDLPPLSSDNYLEHLERFLPLYESGALKNSKGQPFCGFVVVVAPDEETAQLAADLIAQHLGSSLRFHGSHSVPGGTSEGAVVSVSIDDKQGRFKKLFENHGDNSRMVFVGCSDEDALTFVEEDDEKQKRQVLGKIKGWKKLMTPYDHELPLSALPDQNAMQVDGAEPKSAPLSDELKDVINKLRGSPKTEEDDSDTPPGLLVFFPQIPGCGKSSLVDEAAEKELETFLFGRTNPERSLTVRMGDKTKGKYWNIVKAEKKADSSGLYIADKNVPAVSWDLIASVCGEAFAVGVPVIPEHAIQTTVVEGIRWPKDGQVTMNRSTTFPFSLEYLAVCMLRVYSRPSDSHPGKLDKGTERACMIVVMFYCLYQRVSADDFLVSLASNFEKNSAFLAREPVEVPFFQSADTKLPNDLKGVLVEAIRAQCGYNTKRIDTGKEKDTYLDNLEQRLREALEANREFLTSLTVDVEESRQAFLQRIKKTVAQADGGDVFAESGTMDVDVDTEKEEKQIRYVSIDVSPDDVHSLLLQHTSDLELGPFWDIVVGKASPKDVLKGSASSDKNLIRETHVTLAHEQDSSQNDMRFTFGAVEGHTVDVSVLGILWDEKSAALEVELPSTTIQGSVLPPSKNRFAHITLFTGNGTRAFRANTLPGSVSKGKAARVGFEPSQTLSGKITL